MNPDDSKKPMNSKHNQIETGREAEFLDMLRSALDVSIGIFDEDMNYKFISDTLYKQLHISPSDLKVGDNIDKCHELMIKNGMIKQEFLDEAKLTGDSIRFRKGDESKTRSMILTLGDGTTHRFARKEVGNGYIVSMSDDVTEIIEKDKLLEDALRLGDSGYWFLDIETQEYYLSDSLEEYFSREDKNLIRKHGMIGIVHLEDRKRFWKDLSQVDMSNPIINTTIRLTDNGEKERYHDLTLELLQDVTGNWNKVRAFTIDRTQYYHQKMALEAAKNEAIAATNAKSQFLANMSHEIRTPLNGVMGMAELLSRTQVDARQSEFIGIITQSATQLLNIINDILDFSRVEAGEMLIEKAPLDLRKSAEDVCALLTPLASDRGLELIMNYPESMPSQFSADGQRLSQILTNLVGNAIKFTDKGYVSVDVKVTDITATRGLVTIDVVDTGIGIPEANLSNIFGKFTQVDGSTTRAHGGTGLGLSITKSLVELMGGRVKVTSELGKGSKFSVYLPLAYDQDAPKAVTHAKCLSGAKVLIVDDIDVNRKILTETLAHWGAQTVTASSARSALTALAKHEASDHPFDVVITDHLMPEVNGQDFAKAVKLSPNLTDVPMIMLSSCNQDISSDDLTAMGIECYLNKPVRSERLFEVLSAVFSEVTYRQTNKPKITDSLMDKIHGLKPDAETGFCEILVAEDIPLNQNVVRFMLEGSPYTPTFVDNGQLAVDAFKADPNKYAAILMDISMPVLDGLEASKLIRAFQAETGSPQVPIIALTGHALKGDRQKAMDAGLDDYLTKPVNHDDLINMLDKWVNYSRAENTQVA